MTNPDDWTIDLGHDLDDILSKVAPMMIRQFGRLSVGSKVVGDDSMRKPIGSQFVDQRRPNQLMETGGVGQQQRGRPWAVPFD